jgi:hypothetical protein
MTFDMDIGSGHIDIECFIGLENLSYWSSTQLTSVLDIILFYYLY